MKINVREIGDVAVVTVVGNILQEYVSLFRSRLGDLIERGKIRIILDMADSSYISSLCLAVIIDTKNKTSASGGDVKIANANQLVRNLLEITNLNRKIEMYDTIEAAQTSFGSPQQ